MDEYIPLMLTSPTHDDEQLEEFGFSKPDLHLSQQSDNFSIKNRSILVWFTVVVAITAISAAAAFHICILSENDQLQLIRSPADIAAALRVVQPSPNLEKGLYNINQNGWKRPRMIFPGTIVRVNAAEPDRMYHSGSSVVLSPLDSMFYHWKLGGHWPTCYISGWVSSHSELIAGNKSYMAEGDVTAIEIWNVSTPADRKSLKTMSWNTRPERLSIMGTVNFTSDDIQKQTQELDGQELKWPTPRFDCRGKVDLTVEITCGSCHLKFDQIFSDPALGFELLELA